jgi:antitoxin component YwqK of YwqJK toxin-antitoxin module
LDYIVKIFVYCFFGIHFVHSQVELPDGHQTLYYQDSTISSMGKIKDNFPIGEWKNYHLNTQLKSKGNWSAGQLNGTWEFWNENGLKEKVVTYENNLKNGIYLLFDTLEKISFEGIYINDTLQGEFKRFANGVLIEKGKYLNGNLDGKTTFYENDKISKIVDFSAGEVLVTQKLNQTKDGQKIGLWRTVNERGKVTDESFYQNGVNILSLKSELADFNFKKTYYPNGAVKVRYIVENGLKNGILTRLDSLGNILQSEIYDKDTLIGKGLIDKEGVKTGDWEFYFRTGQTSITGNYINGEKTGKWIYYFEDGNIEQQGYYKEDLPDGNWTWYYKSGQVRNQENYYKGQYEGDVIDYDPEGNVLQERTFSYRYEEGQHYYFIGDHLEKGQMTNSLREGVWVYKYDNKNRAFKGKYIDGLPNGKHKFWFPNGRRKLVVTYKNGIKDGKVKEYYPNGGLNHTYIYKDGKITAIDNERIMKRER